MEELFHKQQTTIKGMQQLWSNFKKDSQERKTIEYVNKRVEALNNYWQEFQKVHDMLIMFEDKSHDYFTGNRYEETKAFYLEVKESIQRSALIKPGLFGRHQAGASAAEGRSTIASPKPAYFSRGTDSKIDEKLQKQASNFKAFKRSLANIDLSTVEEKWEYDDILKTVEGRWRAIDSLHWQIDSELMETDDTYEQAFTQHEKIYLEIKKEINRKLWSVSHREKTTPQLEIPVFNGNYQQWVSFKDLFTEAIHGNPCLSNAQKMQFLKSKIRGEPERLIQHLPISADNYVTCWEILNHRYHNKKLIFSTHMNTLMNIPVIQQATSNHVKRIHDVTTECLNGIKNLGVDIDSWDPIIVHLLAQKLDSETLNEYLTTVKQPRELPSLKEFMEFLESKFTAMESARRKQDATQRSTSFPSSSNSRPNQGKHYYVSNKATSQKAPSVTCPVCNDRHGIYFCNQFKAMSPALKRKTVTDLKLCTNCLYNHQGKKCSSNKTCRNCNGPHNTILHDTYDTMSQNTQAPSKQESSYASHVTQRKYESTVLLATALIKVQGADGVQRTLRALIDQGSQASLITENAAQLLRLPRQKCKGVITGVGTKDNSCKGVMCLNCISMDGTYKFNTNVFIMKSLTRNLPNSTFSKPPWAFLEKLQLADPQFYISKPIDLLLGADIYANIVQTNILRGDSDSPIAQETRLGWILFGEVQGLQCNLVLHNIEDIQRFWEMEDIAESSLSTFDAEDECITFYKSTTTRLEDGRYQVRLPIKSNLIKEIGQSKSKAVAQFQQLERKFSKNNMIAIQYKEFIDEYISLGHMKPASSNKKPEYYMPHHCVLRNDSTTTSLRVVFNASCKTSNGTSLNDCMYAGPNLQKDLLTLLLKWRQHRVAFISDVEKMFRQIWVHEDDQNLQKIVWRDSSCNGNQDWYHAKQELQEYQLTTTTYGTKAAPFLAMMTLRQLADDERAIYPLAAQVIENCCYMDDVLYGSSSITSALQLKKDLKNLLKAGGFNLRKWRSNCQELQDNTNKGENQENYDFKQLESTKTLGLLWNSQEDIFTFQSKIEQNPDDVTITKRKLLSEISKLFDPLGWLTPISTKLKLLFQSVWQENLSWDDKLPENINREWLKIQKDLKHINQFKIPRWIGTLNCEDSIELHGFCDASQKAYACVIYCKTINRGQVKLTLLVAKSRLLPCSKNITLPKLELSGALLLSKLMAKAKESFLGHNIEVYGWTDSTAVLGWLQGDPDRWKVFVANRVRQITQVMPSGCWRYVKSAENPADCASRGLSTSNLKEHDIWWNGPHWLFSYLPEKQLVTPLCSTSEETKPCKQVHALTQENRAEHNIIDDLLLNFSSFMFVVRVLAWVRRFITRKTARLTENYVTLIELRKTKTTIIKHVQGVEFEQEILDLKKGGRLSNGSKILNLSPFLDQDGVLRVGGRLHYATINTDLKHPIILPHNHRLTELIIQHAHKLTYHGGARITMAYIRQKYWIIGGNNATKKQIRRCVTCKKHNPNKLQPMMGDLPVARITPSRPFTHTGVDFTGHVFIKTNKGRGVKTTKGYVAVFVCMVTKAVHLELVSDLTTSSFLAAMRRMAARRGTPQHMYSDNGRNFLGASKVLQQEYQELQELMNDSFLAEVADMAISWHFNAPSWPSAGGLWEAAVKSFKMHLKRVIGEQRLTYEEFSTLLTQIEGCLNSRPLCAISEDPEDINFLTPAHFLSGGPTLTIIETERDLRTRWQLTQKILQDLWKRWRAEYLTQLNTRSKWRHPQPNIKIDDVVLIHDDNLPPGKWALGRIIELHPGKDGHVRVVSLKTKNGIMKRPVIKLSILLDHKDLDKQSYMEQIVTSKQVDESAISRKSTRETRNKSNNPKFKFTSIVAALMFFFSFIANSECLININQFTENQGIYFDKMANMMLIKDDWKLVVYYNMDSYWQSTKIYDKYMQSLKRTCDIIKGQVHCDVIVLQLRHAFSELEHYNEVLLSQHSGARPTRLRRRGLINGVGYVANSLFGVLDESFAEKYRKDISHLRENENHIVSLWKNQTSLIEAENNILKRTEHTINQQLKMINSHMNALESAVNKLKENVQTSDVINDFNTGAIIASNMIYNLKSVQSTLLDTVTDIYNGRFNLQLLTPGQLIDELNAISSKLPKDMSLPIDNIHSDIRKIYELLKIKTRILENIIIFEIKIPLISRDVFELFKIIPIPRTANQNMVYVIPVSDYVSINMKKDIYMPLSESEVQSCLTISETYYCHYRRPIHIMKGDKSLCETDGSECKTSSRLCKNRWLETHIINNYFYYCCDRCHVRVMCGDQVSAHQLTRAGLITIGHGCIIKTDDFTIFSHTPYLSELRTTSDIYAPVIAPINHIINISIPQLVLDNKTQNLEQEVLNVGKQIQYTKETEVVLSDDLSYHDIHHYVVIYLLVGICCVAGIIVVVRRTSLQCRWRVSPTTPRTPVDVEEARIAPAAPAPALPRRNHTPVHTSEASGHADFARLYELLPRNPRVDKATTTRFSVPLSSVIL